MITFERVEVGYDQTLLCADSIVMNSGLVYALIGANGSGKSTFMKTVCGTIPLIKGRITLNTQEISSMSSAAKSKSIAFVDAHFRGVDFLSVYEYVSLGRTPHTDFMGNLTDMDREKTKSAIQRVGMSSKINESTVKLSDGERQLISIARAIAQEPRFILLDEPTAFLDYGNRKKLLKTLSEIAKEENIIVLLSSHDIELCLDAQLELLVVDYGSKELRLLGKVTDIDQITRLAFP